MPAPGFNDPAEASRLSTGDLYFEADKAVAVRSPGENIAGGPGHGQSMDRQANTQLMFGGPETHTAQGEVIVHASQQSKGGLSDILNFHGSPAPWVLIGILLVAGMLHLSAQGKLGFGGRV